MKTAILEKNSEDVINSYLSGDSMTTIGKKYNCNSGLVYFFLKKMGIKTRPHQNFEGHIDDYEQEIVDMYKNDKTIKQICKKLKMSEPTVYRKLHSLGYKFETSYDPNNLLKDCLNEVIELFENGNSINEIGRKLGFNATSIIYLLRDNDFDTSKYKYKYTVDESFFEKINTWEKAYILGWFYSDGNIRDEGKNRIAIAKYDEEILYKIKEIMRYTGPLYNIPKKDENCEEMSCLDIGRVKMTRDLIRLGCMPAKSLILTFPTLEQVPKHLIPAFLLGVFDGDGSIYTEGGKLRYCSITGTDVFCSSITEYMKEFGAIPTNFYYRYPEKPEKPTGSLFFCRFEDAKAFLRHIYQDSPFSLERKRQKYIETCMIA